MSQLDVEVLPMPRTQEKTCTHCGQPIRGKRPQALYCSVRCRLDAQIERRRQRIKKRRGEDPFWRDGRWWQWCGWCCERFWTRRPDAQYCSPACRQAGNRAAKPIHEYLLGPGSWDADHGR
jgi:hypothetical protein